MAIEVKDLPFIRSIFPKPQTATPETFKSVAVIGASGKVGELVATHVADLPQVQVEPVLRGEVAQKLQLEPELIILATPNPADGVLQEIAKHIKRPSAVVVLQNGLKVVPAAKTAFENSQFPITLIRGSLDTNVDRNEDGSLLYNLNKKRLGLSFAGDADPNGDLPRAQNTLQQAGFRVEIDPNYRAMEATKLESNLVGFTTAITGLSLRETFTHGPTASLEYSVFKQRRRILRAAGIEHSSISWNKKLDLVEKLPLWVLWLARHKVASIVSKERYNMLPATARLIEQDKGKEKKDRSHPEATEYYLKAVLDLADQVGMDDPADRAMFKILTAHQEGVFNLADMTKAERIKLLKDTIKVEKVETYTPGKRLLAMVAEGLIRYGLRSFNITGDKNLAQMREYLEEGKNVILLANHSSHSDHALIVMALKQKLGESFNEESIRILAGMLWGRDIISRVFERTYPKIRVWTTMKGTKGIEKFLSRIVNKKAEPIIEQSLNEGDVELIYPEGTRSEELRPAIPAVSLQFGHEKTGGVFPVTITGSTDLLPPADKSKKGFAKIIETAFLVARLFKGRRARVGIHFSEAVHPGRGDREALDGIMETISSHLPEPLRGPYPGERGLN